MYLKCVQGDFWSKAKIMLGDSRQKDYDHFQNSEVEVFIYGYPYDEAKAVWLSAADLCQLYSRQGTKFAGEIEGYYTILILDQAEEKCLVITDRYGIYNLFFFASPDAIIISDNIGEIVSHLPSVKLNRQSIMEFLNFGFVLGTKTHIKGIEKFKPATIYAVTNGLILSEETYWQYFSGKERGETKAGLRDLFNSHISTGLKLEERISLPLTGGFDTRTILSTCLPAKERLHCYTHGLRSSFDVKIARKISWMFDIPYDVYSLDDRWERNIPLAAEKNAEIFNGMINLFLYMHLEYSLVKEQGEGEVLFPGISGGEIFRGYYVTPDVINAKSSDDVASALRKRLQLSPAFDVYQDLDRNQLESLLNEFISQELQKAKVGDPVSLAEYLCLANGASNFLAYSQRLAGKYFKLFNPYIYHKLADAIPSFDVKEKLSGALNQYIISRNNPALEKVLMDTGLCVNPRDPQMRLKSFLVRGLNFLKQRANLVSAKLFGTKIFGTQRYVDYSLWLRTYHTQYVRDVVDYQKMILRSLFDRQRLEVQVDSFLNGKSSLLHFITGIMSLEIWLKRIGERTYIDEEYF